MLEVLQLNTKDMYQNFMPVLETSVNIAIISPPPLSYHYYEDKLNGLQKKSQDKTKRQFTKRQIARGRDFTSDDDTLLLEAYS